MSSSRVLGVGLAIALVAVIAGLSVWITSRVAHTRYQRLTALGVIAQRDNRGRVTQINLWPANMAAEGFERLPQLRSEGQHV